MVSYNSPLADFDEAKYLQSNPDVNDAVGKGYFTSGWDHYFRFGHKEKWRGVATEIQALMDSMDRNISPRTLAPPDLRLRVSGVEEEQMFDEVGRMIALDLEGVLQSVQHPLGPDARILDFGCGCGRVLRWFQTLHPESSFYGTDIDKESMQWCETNMRESGSFTANAEMPPLPYQNEYFDFIYSISVFTHLPEDMQLAWLEELLRVTRKDGYLVLTIHNVEILDSKLPPMRRLRRKIGSMLGRKGFYYFLGDKTEGLPDFYRQTFHTWAYVRKEWGRFFKVEKIIRRGIGNFQDLVLCKRVE